MGFSNMKTTLHLSVFCVDLFFDERKGFELKYKKFFNPLFTLTLNNPN